MAHQGAAHELGEPPRSRMALAAAKRHPYGERGEHSKNTKTPASVDALRRPLGSAALPIVFRRPDHRGAVRVLHLDPVPRRAGSIRRVQPFRYDAFEARLTGLREDQGAFLIGVLAQHDPEPAPAQQPRQEPQWGGVSGDWETERRCFRGLATVRARAPIGKIVSVSGPVN
jgi:hypothetical protein